MMSRFPPRIQLSVKYTPKIATPNLSQKPQMSVLKKVGKETERTCRFVHHTTPV